MRDAWVTVDRGRIVGAAVRPPGAGSREIELGDVVVMPGLVNAHTHLELSYLRDEVPPASRFVDWIRHVIAARRTRPDPASPRFSPQLTGRSARRFSRGRHWSATSAIRW